MHLFRRRSTLDDIQRTELKGNRLKIRNFGISSWRSTLESTSSWSSDGNARNGNGEGDSVLLSEFIYVLEAAIYYAKSTLQRLFRRPGRLLSNEAKVLGESRPGCVVSEGSRVAGRRWLYRKSRNRLVGTRLNGGRRAQSPSEAVWVVDDRSRLRSAFRR